MIVLNNTKILGIIGSILILIPVNPIMAIISEGPSIVLGTIGKDSNGDSIFAVIDATSRIGQDPFGLSRISTVPGTLVVIGLNEKTTDTVQTTTVTTTAINIVTAEGVSEGLSPIITYVAVAV